jgi:hypothetical protein
MKINNSKLNLVIITISEPLHIMYKFPYNVLGILPIPERFVNTSFILNGYKDETFYIGDLDISNFQLIAFLGDNSSDSNYHCLSAEYDPNSYYLGAVPIDCHAKKVVICRTYEIFLPSCSDNQQLNKTNTFDFLLDPEEQANKRKAISQKKTNFKDMMTRLDQTQSFKALFSSLWYATLPCYDIKDITAKNNGERAVLKYCEWKGQQIPCAAIFSPYPTDHGMCCSFNMKAAEDIFQDGAYPDVITGLQNADDEQSFSQSILPNWYTDNSEPTTLPGRNKGLFLMLDAHMDQFATASIDSDYDTFMGLINPSGSFPMMSLEGFEIKPGHLNVINLAGSRIDADDGMKAMAVADRKCMFSDENSNLKIHKNYTFSNCIFECSLLYARNQMSLGGNNSKACIPWFFPTPGNLSVYVCDPWESVKFLRFMSLVPDNECSKCLPDCSTTVYEPYTTAVPFRKCDSGNLGVSRLCNLSNKALPQPSKFGYQVKAEYASRNMNPEFINGFEPSTRTYYTTLPNGDVFTQNPKTYDAYDKDIALVQIFFRKSTMFQMGKQPRMTWIDYLSTVGGLLGLVLGMGIVSFIELIWLCMRVAALKMNLTHLVP